MLIFGLFAAMLQDSDIPGRRYDYTRADTALCLDVAARQDANIADSAASDRIYAMCARNITTASACYVYVLLAQGLDPASVEGRAAIAEERQRWIDIARDCVNERRQRLHIRSN